jgi:hypothetical protein
LRCVAPRAASTRALDARARLERVAAGPLAAALDRALGDVEGDVRIESLRVDLDLDPADYDDETLAYLWASRIAAALAPHVAAAPAPSWVEALLALAAVDVASVAALLVARGLPDVPEGSREAVLAVLRRAASAAPATPMRRSGAPAAATTPPPASLPTAAAVPAPRDPLAAAPPPTRAALPPTPGAAPPPPPAPPRADTTRAPNGAWERAWHDAAAVAPATPSLAARTVASAAARPASPRAASDAFLSAAGGLVLLYPWLAAAVPECDLAPEDARRATYAALAGDPYLQHDPLVRLLAGLDPAAPTLQVDVDVDPEPVLRAFAGMLRGFEASSAAYLQEHLIRRPARVEPLGDAVLVRLSPMPLDVVLNALPYPLGVVRLPWTPPLAVELRC